MRNIKLKPRLPSTAEASSGFIEAIIQDAVEGITAGVFAEVENYRAQLREEATIHSSNPIIPGKVYFSVAELCKRWGLGKTSIFEISEEELQVRHIKSSRRYLALDVYAFEKLISRDKANRAIQAGIKSITK